MNAVQKLRSVLEEIRGGEPLKVVDGWALAGRLLARMPVDQEEAVRVVSEKDVEGLDALVRGLESPGETKGSAGAGGREDAGGGAGAGGGYETATLQAAMKAFKKRLKLGRLADESKLGGRYTSGGRTSQIDAIEPPRGFEAGVWKALAAEGKLRDFGGGFYGLAERGAGDRA